MPHFFPGCGVACPTDDFLLLIFGHAGKIVVVSPNRFFVWQQCFREIDDADAGKVFQWTDDLADAIGIMHLHATSAYHNMKKM